MGKARWWSVGVVAAVLTLLWAGVAFAHDLFLEPISFLVPPNSDAIVRVINGTFTRSENSIARTRLADVSVVTAAGREHIDTTAWTATGDTSTLRIHTGAEGTYVIAASTRPSVIALKAADFNAYLQEDGIADVLAARKSMGELDEPARERYAKHVKSLIQVGEARTSGFSTVLGYPAEIVPLDNPYSLAVGASMRVQVLAAGEPIGHQEVLYGGLTPTGAPIVERSLRSDADGNVTIPLRARGTWYVKFVRMFRTRADTVDYISNWATLTFELR